MTTRAPQSGRAAQRWRDRRVLVMGLGRFGGGLGAARHFVAAGARVTVTDRAPAATLGPSLAALDDLGRSGGTAIRTVLGEHRRADFEEAELVVVNPAVPPGSPFLAAARAAGARVATDVELFLEATAAGVVAVTGTQGKSSTCHLLHGLLSAAGVRTELAGNVGRSPLPLLETAPELVVLELSSYQLELLCDGADPARLAPAVRAVGVTNVGVDHLERHGSAAAYAAAKRRILALVPDGGAAVLPAGDGPARAWRPARGRRLEFDAAERAPGAGDAPERGGPELFLADGRFRMGGEVLGHVADLQLPGRFQRANALLALGLARLLGASPETLRAGLGELRGLEHRLQELGRYGGRRVWDNGVSTTPDSTLSALRSMPAACTLLCGGQAKDLPLDELAGEAVLHVRLAVTFGAAAELLAGALAARGVRTVAAATLEEGVHLALRHTPAGGELLFSPACSSFDAYSNFHERALAFRAALPEPDPIP